MGKSIRLGKGTLGLVICIIYLYSPSGFAQWKVYINKRYQFKISYPAFLVTKNRFSTSYFLGPGWSINKNGKNNSLQHSLFEIQLKNIRGEGIEGEKFYYKAYVRVGVSTDPFDLSHCQERVNNFISTSPPKFKIINSNRFLIFNFSDAGMSQYLKGTRLKNKVCYSIEEVETCSRQENIPQYNVISHKNQALARKIIETFRHGGVQNRSKKFNLKVRFKG
ncbi:hypothetical protein [Coxiella burnetii]|uniref:hypothetical protein n=1 Tax=Coxiella burnetii TaxID=777 RepID=UPI000183D110|nr:hypothetical protein [Coxiella burnetii]ACJ18396.1 hypothetical membrane-associated protein [Coxiella burnetii CbuG_Q212]ATN66776.1 hypothetical protein AYM17_05075 [Coxiella burnetii]OYK86104.1 hypothetical protein CbuQ229_05305 [Coxiella burnetii]